MITTTAHGCACPCAPALSLLCLRWSTFMKVIVGTNNGQLKVINLDENVQTSLFGNYELNNAVETMCWANPESEDLVGAGYSNGAVNFWNPLTKQLQFNCGKRNGKVKGLYTFEKESGRMVVTCTDTKQFEICPVELPEDYKHTSKRLEGNNDSSIWKMRPNPLSPQHMLYAGYHIMPTLYDIERGKTVWRGQFGKPKFFGLKQRQFFTDFQFMPESASVFATGSRYREFRIYDLRKGPTPVIDFDVTKTSQWEFAMISLAVTYHTPTIIYATEATGKIGSFDLRTGRLHKVYRDGMGTVKSLAFHPTERAMAAKCNERMTQIDIDKKLQRANDKKSLQFRVRIAGMVGANMYNKMFLKQKLNSILFFSEARIQKVIKEEEKVEEVKEEIVPEIKEESGGDIWEDLEEVTDVKDEDDDEEGMIMNVKDDEESDNEIIMHSAKPKIKKEQSKNKGTMDSEEDEEEEEEEGGEGEESEEEIWNDADTDFEIKMGEFNDDDDEVEEGGDGDGENAEEEGDSDDDAEDLEEETPASKAKGEPSPKGTTNGEKKTDNKRKRREAKEKLEKQKKLKQMKVKEMNAKKGRAFAKKKKTLLK